MAEDVGVDYTRAVKLIDEYYTTQLEIANGFIDSADRALLNFFLTSSIKEEKVDFDLLGLLIDTVTVFIPHVKIVKMTVGKLTKSAQKAGVFLEELTKEKIKAVAEELYDKAEEAAKGKVKSAIQKAMDDGSSEDNDGNLKKAAVQVNDELGNWRRAWIGMILFERLTMEKCLDLIYENRQNKRGKLNETFKKIFEPMPVYDSNSLAYFQKSYEINLYRQFWHKKGYWIRTVKDSPSNRNVRLETTELKVIPNAVGERVKELLQMPTVQSALASWLMRVDTKYEELSNRMW
jgi:hypothetical protein